MRRFVNLSVGRLTADKLVNNGNEINLGNIAKQLSTISSAEFGVIDGVTAGTVTASKAAVVNATKDIGDFRNLDAVNVDAGASGTAGTVDVFPATESKGKLAITCADQTGNTTVTIQADEMGQATTVHIPDPGAAASYVVQTTAALSLAEADVLQDVTAGTVTAGKAVVAGAVKEANGLIPSTSVTVTGAVPAYRLVKGHTDSSFIVADSGTKRIIGANLDNATKTDEACKIGAGYVTVVAAEPIIPGEQIKCGDNGRVLQLANADNVSTSIGTGTAGNFGNQPANDAVEVISSEAADTTQTVTIIGTTNGGHTVVVEDVVLTGTTEAATTKVDWGLIIGVKLSAACTGTVTVREASGDKTITTIAPAALSAGVVEVAAASQGAHGLIPYMSAGGESTKEVGIKYEPATGAAETYGAAALNGTNAVALPAAANRITEIYLGDVATGTTATVYSNASEDDEQLCIGKACAAIATGASGLAYIRP